MRKLCLIVLLCMLSIPTLAGDVNVPGAIPTPTPTPIPIEQLAGAPTSTTSSLILEWVILPLITRL